jgi:hypothetical protein
LLLHSAVTAVPSEHQDLYEEQDMYEKEATAGADLQR